MKRRHRSTIVKRHVTVIHATIRLSNSLPTTNNTSLEHHKSLPSVTDSRNISDHRGKSKKTSIVSIIDTNSNGTKRRSERLSKTQRRKTHSMKSVHQSSNDKSNSTNSNTKNEHKDTEETTICDEQFPSTSPKLNPCHYVSNNNIGQTNDNNNIQSHRTDLTNEHHRKNEEKYISRKRKRLFSYCCSCSRLCAIASLFTGLLVGIAIAAIIVALLTKSKTTTVVTVYTSTTTLTITTTTSTSTASTTSTSTTSTTSTTATTTLAMISIGSTDPIYGIWNTTAGGDSTLATPGWGIGNYVSVEPPQNAFDQNCVTKYTTFGNCVFNPSWSSLACGLDTGFYVTPGQGATIMKGLRFCTGNDNPQRDPLTMTLEGSNQTGSSLMLGSSWNLIFNGSTGLDVDPNRGSLGVAQSFSNNLIAYLSYRILITSKRGADPALQYSEVQLFAF